MDRKNIDKIAQTPDDRLLLAKLWDKISAGIGKNIIAHTAFLSPREQQLAHFLFGDLEGLQLFGGYSEAERKMLIYLPDYLDEDYLAANGPIVCLQGTFYKDESPTHRDFLGALMGIGIVREAVGDILVGDGCCCFFVTEEIAPYILQQLDSAGRTSLQLQQIPIQQAIIPAQAFSVIQDTVSSMRFDSILSSGFRISRSAACEYIAAGRAAIDGVPCQKPDRTVTQGSKLSLRGLGKIQLIQIGHITKKGRISVTIHRYE